MARALAVLGLPSLPNPFSSLPGDIFGGLMSSMYHAVSDAVDQVGQNLIHFMNAQATVNFAGGWWTSGRTDQLMGVVVRLSEYVMILCVLLAIMQGVLRGTPGLAVKAVAVDVPLSVLGIVVVATAVQGLAAVVDWASAQVLAGVPGDIGHFLITGGGGSVIGAGSAATFGLLPLVLLIVFFFTSLLVWIELVIRSAAIYLLVAMTPLALAGRVWPAAAGMWRKLIEGIVALTLAKFVIALAVGLGAAAVAGGGATAGMDLGGKAGAAVAGVLVGSALMLVALLAPFVLLKLIPVGEAALVSSEVRRMGTSKATQAALIGMSMGRLSGAGGAGATAGSAGGMAGPASAVVAGAAKNAAPAASGSSSTAPPARVSGGPVGGGPNVSAVPGPPGPASPGASGTPKPAVAPTSGP